MKRRWRLAAAFCSGGAMPWATACCCTAPGRASRCRAWGGGRRGAAWRRAPADTRRRPLSWLVASDHPALGDDVAVAHGQETLGGVQVRPVPAGFADAAGPVPDDLAVQVALAGEHAFERGDLSGGLGGDRLLAALGAPLFGPPGTHARPWPRIADPNRFGALPSGAVCWTGRAAGGPTCTSRVRP